MELNFCPLLCAVATFDILTIALIRLQLQKSIWYISQLQSILNLSCFSEWLYPLLSFCWPVEYLICSFIPYLSEETFVIKEKFFLYILHCLHANVKIMVNCVFCGSRTLDQVFVMSVNLLLIYLSWL